jgi:hypothetical protein
MGSSRLGAVLKRTFLWSVDRLSKDRNLIIQIAPLFGMKKSAIIVHPDSYADLENAERRSKLRFPVVMRVCYRTFEKGALRSGEGWVTNMSPNGVLISAKHEVSSGERMELNIEWPSLLHGEIPLRFVSAGEVVRCDASSFAVKLVGHQFRTAKRKVTPTHALTRNKRLAVVDEAIPELG